MKKQKTETGILAIVDQLGKAKDEAREWKAKAKLMFKAGRKQAKQFDNVLKRELKHFENVNEVNGKTIIELAEKTVVLGGKVETVRSYFEEVQRNQPDDQTAQAVLEILNDDSTASQTLWKNYKGQQPEPDYKGADADAAENGKSSLTLEEIREKREYNPKE